MRFRNFEWDETNTTHLSKHALNPDAVEEACSNNPFVTRGRHNRYYAYGQTDSGRYLMVVIQPKWNGISRVITARDMDQTERRRYLRR